MNFRLVIVIGEFSFQKLANEDVLFPYHSKQKTIKNNGKIFWAALRIG